MKNIDGIESVTRPLARVEPGQPGGHPSGAGARTLLASITAEEPGTAAAEPRRARRYGPRRLALGLAAVAVLATGAVVGPSLLQDGRGADPAYAVTKDANGVVYVKVRDFHDAAGLTRQLKDLGVPAVVDYVPEGQQCREPRATYVTDVPRGLYYAPTSIPGEEGGFGWQMRIDTKLFKDGQTFVWTIGESGTSTILMNDPVAPCALVPADPPKPRPTFLDYRVATAEGRSLAGYRVDGKTVGEVVPEIEKRGLKVTYMIIEPYPGNPGGYSMDPARQDIPVGKDWVVWEAQEPRRSPGEVRLVVTDKRYDRSPLGDPED
ncbi:hypothetical protein [Streptosporangium canum]|uniref:hypothetical protein n=1 Tax=Streptosporangium canum TaxID=324952 RepID=UPI0036755A6F